MRMFKVGGCVRDSLMGRSSKDIDFACEAESMDAMRAFLVREGFQIFVETPEFFTIRAHFPKSHPEFGRTTADFVLCRRDGFSSDSRRPDEVFVGTIFDDLARRDFTMNAIAEPLEGPLLDPHGGVRDIDHKALRFVGDPMTRIREDSLRALRGLRFMVTLGFSPVPSTWEAIVAPETAGRLRSVSSERIVVELHKMFVADTLESLALFAELPEHLQRAIIRPGIKVIPTMKDL